MKTNIFSYIFSAISIIAIFASCSNESLDEITLPTINLIGTWENNHPRYEVKIENCNVSDASNIRIYEQVERKHQNRYDWRTINLSSSNLTNNDTHWTLKKGDILKAIAIMETPQGKIRSENAFVYEMPNGLQPVIESVTFDLYPNERGKIVITGHDFDVDGDLRFKSQNIDKFSGKLHITPTRIEYDYYGPSDWGTNTDELIINGMSAPFSFELPQPTIKASKTEIKHGETITVTVTGFNPEYELDIWNSETISRDGNTYLVKPKDLGDGTSFIRASFKDHDIFQTEAISITFVD